MDPMIAKLIESRRASIGALESDIEKLSALAAAAKDANVANSFGSILTVKKQRLAKLYKELRGFVVASGQTEIPGTDGAPAAKPPVKR